MIRIAPLCTLRKPGTLYDHLEDHRTLLVTHILGNSC